MGYLVLARKWRPQSFGEVIDQGPVVQALQNAVRYGRVAHAFLFAGARGVGKTSVARILAKALDCEKGPTETPCNQCSICREITNGSAVDIYEIDGASNRGIDEIRELRENVRYLPAKCRYKIYIIDEVHMLTQEAFNALLKTLEEPPAHVIFIFATTEPHKIPITILSRCQRYDFKRLSLQAMTDHLKAIVEQEGINLSEGCLRFIAREAEGSMRDALSLLDRIISYGEEEVTDEGIASIFGLTDHRLIMEITRALFEHDLETTLRIIDRVYAQGHDIKRFYGDLVETIRNLIILRTCQAPDQLINVTEDEKKELDRLGQARSVETIYQYLQLLLRGWDELRRSLQPKLTLEMILMRASLLKDIVPVEKILEKLSTLEVCPDDRLLQDHRQATAYCEQTDRESDGKFLTVKECEVSPVAAGSEDREAFLNFVKSRNLPLASIVQQCQELTVKNDTLEIAFADSSLSELLEDSLHKARLQDICREYYKRDLRINIVSESATSSDRKMVQETDYLRTAQEEILRHPMVQEAISIFEGHIEEIKVEKN